VKHLRRYAIAGVILALLSGSAEAGLWPFPDGSGPAMKAALSQIAQILQFVNQRILGWQEHLQARIRTVVHHVAFPYLDGIPGVFQALPYVIDEVRGIRTEIRDLSCAWQWSSRTQIFRDMSLHHLQICRPEVKSIWGSSAFHWNAPEAELEQHAAAMTENLLSAQVQAQYGWESSFHDMSIESAMGGRRSPGLALRDTAFMTAALGRVAQNNSEIAAWRLYVASLDAAEQDEQERLNAVMALGIYNSIATLDKE
jgi:hypothetical protein